MLTFQQWMEPNVAHTGPRFTIEYAIRKDATSPGLDFFNGLDSRWKARLLTLYSKLCDTGVIRNKEQFNKFGVDDFFEFKAYQVRMPCYFRPGKRIVITHGFFKKREGAAPQSESERARNIRAEYEDRIAAKERTRR
jgi:Phage derived protein Gp49-like (DUF891)